MYIKQWKCDSNNILKEKCSFWKLHLILVLRSVRVKQDFLLFIHLYTILFHWIFQHPDIPKLIITWGKKQLLRWLILSTWIHLPRCRLPRQHNTLVTKNLHSHVLEINVASEWLYSWWEVTMTKSFHSMIHFRQYPTVFLFHDSFSLCDKDISDVSHSSQRLVLMESKDFQVLGFHWEPKVQILQNWAHGVEATVACSRHLMS